MPTPRERGLQASFWIEARTGSTNPAPELQARAVLVPSVLGGKAFTHPRVQPQRQVPRDHLPRPDGGLGPLEPALVHAPVPRWRDRLDAQAGLRPGRERGG